METLIAVIDELNEAKSFIGFVAHMAFDFDMKVHYVFIQEPYDYTLGQPPSASYLSSSEVQKINAIEAKKTMERLITEVRKEIPGEIAIDYSTEISNKSVAVMEYISSNKASMAILEAREQKGFWTFTSSYMDVINNTNCPVWIIPHKTDYKPIRQIVYATDYKEEDLGTLRKFIGMTSRQMPDITALHVCDSVDFEERVKQTGFNEMVQEKTGYKNITVKCMTEKEHANVAHLINDFALEIKADLIVLLKENRSFIELIFHPDSTKKIVKEAQLPVLVYMI